MKYLKFITLAIIILFSVISCNKDDVKPKKQERLKKIVNLYTPAKGIGRPITGSFTKFSFKEGKKVTGDNWDIAFRATQIIVNGGKKGAVLEDIERTKNAAIVLKKEAFGSIKQAPDDKEFKQDSPKELALTASSDKGWYHYSGSPNHLILPISGRVLVIRTFDGHYAKMKIITYYKDNKPSETTSKYYTFDYVYNPTKGDKNLE